MNVLKRLDQLFGKTVVKLLPVPDGGPTPSALSKILVIRPGGIGDAVLLIPALQALKKAFPVVRITVLAEKRNASVFDLTNAVSEVLLYHNPGDLLSVFKGGYDAVIDTEQWHRLSAVVSRLARAPLSVGFGTNERRKSFSHAVDYSHSNHETRSFLSLLEPLGVVVPHEVAVPFLKVPEKATSRGEQLLAPLHGQNYAVLFPGSTVAEKQWGMEKLRELVAMLNERGVRVIVIGGKEDRDHAAWIAGNLVDLNLAGRTTLAESSAIIQKAKVLITGDSGVMHLASGLGTPSVSLFGPSNVQKWGPLGEKHLIIHRGLSCSPCSRFGYTPPCPSGVACMAGISVDEVAEATFRLLRR